MSEAITTDAMLLTLREIPSAVFEEIARNGQREVGSGFYNPRMNYGNGSTIRRSKFRTSPWVNRSFFVTGTPSVSRYLRVRVSCDCLRLYPSTHHQAHAYR
jgi:hypothetical protein